MASDLVRKYKTEERIPVMTGERNQEMTCTETST